LPRRPTKADTAPHRAHAGALLAQVRLYRLTTVRVVARNFFGGSDVAATRALEALCARHELARHEASGGVYYTVDRVSLEAAALAEAWAVLWFCRMTRPAKPLLSPREFRALVAGMREAGVELPRDPRVVRAYRTRGCLHLLRVQPLRFDARADVVARALVLLQDVVASEGFAPWWTWARHDLLRLVYLVRDAAPGEELARWTTRHPLCSHVGGSPVIIPLDVVTVPPFPGAR
jgi:hypothetical protein